MRRLVLVLFGLFVTAGLFAPIVANDVPIVAQVGGTLHFPALWTYAGDPPPGPDGVTWKRWESRLTGDSTDWAVMPPIPYGPFEAHRGCVNRPPSMGEHYFGNDDTGRDVLARVVHGARTALWIALGVVALALCIGVPIGAAAGYYGGWLDLLLSGLVQIFVCFPPVFFVLAVMAFLGSSLGAVIAVLGLLYWVSFARIVRGEVLRLRDREFVRCARGLGVGTTALLARHILPSVRGPILVNAAFVAASAIVIESTLSFLGLGPSLATVSWGMILLEGRSHAAAGAWHLWLFPSVVLVATVVCLHTLADHAANGRATSVRGR